MDSWRNYTRDRRIAYFSMEIGMSSDIPTYSGGLGILAGDTIKSAADLKVPMVGLTLVHRKGYFRQHLDEKGHQREEPACWQPERYMTLIPTKSLVTIEGRDVKVQAWLYEAKSPTGGKVPVLFIDTDIPGNDERDRTLTDHLYGGDPAYRLKQEMILGIGGTRLLSALGFHISKYHMNEGHAALLTLELLTRCLPHQQQFAEFSDMWEINHVREKCIFTTHTPVESGHDRFPWEMVEGLMPQDTPFDRLKRLANDDQHFNLTLLAMNLSRYVNGVAKHHGAVSSNLYPGFKIHAITNGIHPFTWASPFTVSLFDRFIPGWANEPELLVRVDSIPDEILWETHQGSKALFFQYVEEVTGCRLDPEVLTIGSARRITSYKRNDLIFHDIERLLQIGQGKIQLVFAGKAHPQDDVAKGIIERIYRFRDQLKGQIEVVYLDNYSMDMTAKMIPGVDLWLNTPMQPLEASGTSGMKAALNGVPNFSVLDGWWLEGHIEGVTGWSIGLSPDRITPATDTSDTDVEDLYTKLEQTILPMFYNNRNAWIQVMKGAIGKNGYYFTTHMMMRRYVTEAYLN